MPGNQKKTQFKKGQSGNPKGRPKGRRDNATILKIYLEKMAKGVDFEGEEILAPAWDVMNIRMIYEAMQGNTTAYNAIIDRIEGKPKQTINNTVNAGTGLNITVRDHGAAEDLAKVDKMLSAPQAEEEGNE